MKTVAQLATALTRDVHSPELHRHVAALLRRPLVRQVLLLLPFTVTLFALMVSGTLAASGRLFLSGLLILSVVTLVTVVRGRQPAPTAALSAITLLDLLALGLMRSGAENAGLGMLAVLPAVWLALDHGMRGVTATVVAVLGAVSLPSLLVEGWVGTAWPAAVTIPAVAGMCSLSVAVTTAAWAQQASRLAAQQERLEDALAEVTRSRALNEAIVTTADVGLVALDRHGEYLLVNPTQREILRQAFPQGHGGSAGEPGLIYDADRRTVLDREQRPSYRAMRGEMVTDQLCWVGADPQHQRALSISARPVLDVDGGFDGAVLVYMDVTDLVSALQVKDEFVASVSHELRTPLTSILGYLELVLDMPGVDHRVRQRLEIVRRNADRLLVLVTDLLLTAQLDHDAVEMEVGPVDLSATVRQAVVDHAPRAAAGGVTLAEDVQPCLVVPGDPVRLRQLVDNLVTNAIKYTPPTGSITVTLTRCGEETVLEVCDTGVGIAAEDLPRVFTRFYRTEAARTREVQGLGLGLAITRRLVEAHGGHIEVESTSGRGSRFRVRLPRFAGDRVSAGSAAAPVTVRGPDGGAELAGPAEWARADLS